MPLHACLLLFIVTTVQENERTSSAWHSTTHPGQDPVRRSQTGTSFTWTASMGREAVNGTEGGGGRLEEWSSGPRFASRPSSQDQGRLHPTSPLQGLSVSGKNDRETIPFPEEELNNQTETSGAAHLADGPVSAVEGTHPYSQHAHSTDTQFDTRRSPDTETNAPNELPQTRMGLEPTTASSNVVPGTGTHGHPFSQVAELSETTQAYPTASSSSTADLTSSPPDPPAWTPPEPGSATSPHSGAVGGALPHSWRNQRSTDRLDADTPSAVTSDPSTETRRGGWSRDAEPAPSSSSSSQEPNRTRLSSTYIPAPTADAGSPTFPRTAAGRTASVWSSDESQSVETLHSRSSSTLSQTNFLKNATHPPHTSSSFTRPNEEGTLTTNVILSSSGSDGAADRAVTGSSTPTPRMLGDAVQNAAPPTGPPADAGTHTQHQTRPLLHDHPPTNSPTPQRFSSTHTSPSSTLRTHTALSGSSRSTHTPRGSTSSHTPPTENLPPRPSSPAAGERSASSSTAKQTSLLITPTSDHSDAQRGAHPEEEEEEDKILHSSITTQTPTAGPPPRTPTAGPPPRTPTAGPHPIQENHTMLSPPGLTSVPTWTTTATPMPPKFYVVPDEPAAIRVESIDLLLQIITRESTSGLEEDAAAWLEPYLQRAPGFDRLVGAWSRGHAVQTLFRFKTSGALQWLNSTGAASLLERTGLAQVVREGRSLNSSAITNITLGGLQGEVCDWLLQCPAGYRCESWPGASNYTCSSICHFDHCHHHGICTHHPGQFPVCRCIVGQDFWYMGQRCDTRMTHARLVGSCLAVLLIVVTVIGVLAFVAVRRYRAILIQAKVDQTRSSYRRFNHFDELSGRFWLRSWAGSADSLDNPAFTRSDELLHLRTLDRPCCYHDDTLSLPSTCPSHGARINTIYLHSSQYGWRGSEMSLGGGVLDSGKASDLSVCSWPVEPIHWTPFPLLQRLASHKTPPKVRVSRPRSYCEGMELVDLGKSWTA